MCGNAEAQGVLLLHQFDAIPKSLSVTGEKLFQFSDARFLQMSILILSELVVLGFAHFPF
jgi:hypothetical protein